MMLQCNKPRGNKVYLQLRTVGRQFAHSRAHLRRRHPTSWDIGVQAVWRWDEEENLEDEPVPPKSPRRTPAISRKLRRRARALVGVLNPFGGRKSPQLLPFEEPLAHLDQKIQEVREVVEETEVGVGAQIEAMRAIQALERRANQLRAASTNNLAPEQRRALALHPERPAVRDLMGGVCNKFMELHFPGSDDDDSGFCCGVGDLNGVNVMLIGHEEVAADMAEAHRRQLATLVQEAETFGLPIVNLFQSRVTPSTAASARSSAAATPTPKDMLEVRVPVVGVVLGMVSNEMEGEAARGGLLVGGDWLGALQHSVLFHRPPTNEQPTVQLTPAHAKQFHLVDEVLPEAAGGAHRDPGAVSGVVRAALAHTVLRLQACSLQPSALSLHVLR
mmetsp:Transcript_10859/g.20425  ORF Transcript_10859/g.20425 Transcript_10859/m.20425 type:complete len:389 (+) Transcript_10859:549-1715(+)